MQNWINMQKMAHKTGFFRFKIGSFVENLLDWLWRVLPALYSSYENIKWGLRSTCWQWYSDRHRDMNSAPCPDKQLREIKQFISSIKIIKHRVGIELRTRQPIIFSFLFPTSSDRTIFQSSLWNLYLLLLCGTWRLDTIWLVYFMKRLFVIYWTDDRLLFLA